MSVKYLERGWGYRILTQQVETGRTQWEVGRNWESWEKGLENFLTDLEKFRKDPNKNIVKTEFAPCLRPWPFKN